MDVRKYLHSKGFSWKESRRPTGLWATMNCPFCDDKNKKFGVNLEKGTFNCFRQDDCGVSGTFYQLQKRLGDTPVAVNTDNVFHKTIKQKFVKPKTTTNGLNDLIYSWFEKRKISAATLNEFRVTQKDNVVCFNFYKNDELVNVKYRTSDKKFWQEQNTEPALYNMDKCVGHELYICEGEIDCMSFYEAGIKNCVSVPNGVKDLNWITHQWDFLEQFEKIYIVFDQDDAGQEMVDEIATRLGKWRAYNIILPAKDANDVLVKFGVDAFKPENLLVKDFENEDIAKPTDFRTEIIEILESPKKSTGVPTKFTGLNKIIHGWRYNEFSVWTGRNSSGKSTLINEIIIDLCEKKETACMASLEMEAQKFLRWMVHQALNLTFITRSHVDQALEWLDEKLWIYNNKDKTTVPPEILLDAFEYAARKYGCKHFFIDSLMKIKFSSKDEYAEQEKFCHKLCDFKKEFQCHIHLIAHPRKSKNDYEELGKVDIAGTGHITDLADNVFIIHRSSEAWKNKKIEKGIEPPDSILYIRKNREYGLEGKVKFKVDAATKIFREL